MLTQFPAPQDSGVAPPERLLLKAPFDAPGPDPLMSGLEMHRTRHRRQRSSLNPIMIEREKR